MKKHDEHVGYKHGELDRPDSSVKHPASTAPKNPGVGGGDNPGRGGGGHGGGPHKAGGKGSSSY